MRLKNYDRIVEIKRKAREENEQKALSAINYLYESKKNVSVKELTVLTGLSRSFFYKNDLVSKALRKIISLQTKTGGLTSKTEVFNMAAAKSNEILERQVKALQRKCTELEKENAMLRSKMRERSRR